MPIASDSLLDNQICLKNSVISKDLPIWMSIPILSGTSAGAAQEEDMVVCISSPPSHYCCITNKYANLVASNSKYLFSSCICDQLEVGWSQLESVSSTGLEWGHSRFWRLSEGKMFSVGLFWGSLCPTYASCFSWASLNMSFS